MVETRLIAFSKAHKSGGLVNVKQRSLPEALSIDFCFLSSSYFVLFIRGLKCAFAIRVGQLKCGTMNGRGVHRDADRGMRKGSRQ
jgi:hypothetical protein